MSENTRALVIIADDHPLFREALCHAVAQCLPDAMTMTADSLSSLQEVVEAYPDADLLLLDLHMPGVQGFSALVHLRGRYETMPIVIVSGSEDAKTMRGALSLGASGYIPKSSSIGTIRTAIEQVLSGDVWVPEGFNVEGDRLALGDPRIVEAVASLTAHQFRVLQMVSEGLMNKQIAYQLNVSEATIKAHLTAIFRKLGVNNRTQAVVALAQLDVESPAATG